MPFQILTDKPIIGAISGFCSPLILLLQSFFINETALKYVAALGIWGGAFVCLLTIVLKLMEIAEKVKIKRK